MASRDTRCEYAHVSYWVISGHVTRFLHGPPWNHTLLHALNISWGRARPLYVCMCSSIVTRLAPAKILVTVSIASGIVNECYSLVNLYMEIWDGLLSNHQPAVILLCVSGDVFGWAIFSIDREEAVGPLSTMQYICKALAVFRTYIKFVAETRYAIFPKASYLTLMKFDGGPSTTWTVYVICTTSFFLLL